MSVFEDKLSECGDQIFNIDGSPQLRRPPGKSKKVTISTINNIQAKLRKVCKLKVNNDWSLETILFPQMKHNYSSKKYLKYSINW